MQSIDPDVALAEVALERLDELRSERSPDDPLPTVDDSDGLVAHVDSVVVDSDSEPIPDPDVEEFCEVVDAFNESFNARNLDGVLEVVADDVEAPGLGNDRNNFVEALEDVWDRRPTCLLTRGSLGERCVSVVWEPGTDRAWWRIALIHFDDVRDGRIGVVEVTDDQVALDEVVVDGPDGDAEEGTRWEEWAEGAPA